MCVQVIAEFNSRLSITCVEMRFLDGHFALASQVTYLTPSHCCTAVHTAVRAGHCGVQRPAQLHLLLRACTAVPNVVGQLGINLIICVYRFMQVIAELKGRLSVTCVKILPQN
jgi:hypothetical protein